VQWIKLTHVGFRLCDKTGYFRNFATMQFQQILTFCNYNSLNVNSCIITPKPFFHWSYNEEAIASSCLNIAMALVIWRLNRSTCIPGPPIKNRGILLDDFLMPECHQENWKYVTYCTMVGGRPTMGTGNMDRKCRAYKEKICDF